MPRIQWTGLPSALRDHLFDRLRKRKITADDLYQLKTWRESDPDAPTDFGIRTSVRSKSVARENTQRPSCSRANLPRVRSSERRFADAQSFSRHTASAARKQRRHYKELADSHIPELENEIGQKLDWSDPFFSVEVSADIKNIDDWARQHQWVVETAKKFAETFKYRLEIE